MNLSDEHEYNCAFWGNPWEWDEIEDSKTFSVGNLLFHLEENVKGSNEIKDEIARSYFDVFDGYSIRFRHSDNPEDDWEGGSEKCRQPAKAKIENLDDEVCRVACDDVDKIPEFKKRINSDLPRSKKLYIQRFPDLDGGVQLHADLTWEELRICFAVRGETKHREISLSKWGLRSWWEGIARKKYHLGSGEPTEEMVKKLLFTKQMQYQMEGKSDIKIEYGDLRLEGYLRRLANIIPYMQKPTRVRFTGWFSMPAFSKALKETDFASRFSQHEIDTEPSYKYKTHDTKQSS